MSDAYSQALAAVDPGSIASMTPAEATAKLAELTVTFKGTPRIADVMKVEPTDAIGAQAKLKALQEDPAWRSLFEQGNAGARADFAKLTEMIANGSAADFAKAGIVPDGYVDSGTGAMLQDQVAAVKDMMGRGWAPSAIDEIIGDQKPTLEQHEMGKRALAAFMASPQCVAALNAGVREAQWMFRDICYWVGCYP